MNYLVIFNWHLIWSMKHFYEIYSTQNLGKFNLQTDHPLLAANRKCRFIGGEDGEHQSTSPGMGRRQMKKIQCLRIFKSISSLIINHSASFSCLFFFFIHIQAQSYDYGVMSYAFGSPLFFPVSLVFLRTITSLHVVEYWPMFVASLLASCSTP